MSFHTKMQKTKQSKNPPISFLSPWYDLRGWLGVKQHLSIYLPSENLFCPTDRREKNLKTSNWGPCFNMPYTDFFLKYFFLSKPLKYAHAFILVILMYTFICIICCLPPPPPPSLSPQASSMHIIMYRILVSLSLMYRFVCIICCLPPPPPLSPHKPLACT